MEIVYVFIGKLPKYIVETIYQARLFTKDKITLICDDMDSPYLQEIKDFNINIVNQIEYVDEDFLLTIQENLKKFCIAYKLGDRRLLFIRSFERFYVLQKYMETTKAENILFLELDILIYFNPQEFLEILKERELSISYVYNNHMCSAIAYVKNVNILKNLTHFFTEYILNAGPDEFVNEMTAIGKWIQIPENRERTWILPSLWKDERYNPQIYEHLERFKNSIFDGYGLAIAIDGPDDSHREEWIRRGKVWWGTEVMYNEFIYEWKIENGLRFVYAKATSDATESYKVQCLHVHSKNLGAFLSKERLQYDSNPYIHGDQFLKLADIVLRKKTRTDYYEIKEFTPKKILYFEDIPESWDNPKILFANTEDVLAFENLLSRIKNPFVLLTHNSDENVTDKYAFLYNHPKLAHWFTQNLCISHPKLSLLPIGIANPIWFHGNYSVLAQIRQMNLPKKNFVYANFLIETNKTAREYCAKILQEKEVPIQPRCHPFENWQYLAQSYFSICPEGNGIDTHRFWESLYLRTIPVILRNPLTEQLAKEYPCILLEKWEDLEPNVLQINTAITNQDLFTKLSFGYFANKIHQTLATL